MKIITEIDNLIVTILKLELQNNYWHKKPRNLN